MTKINIFLDEKTHFNLIFYGLERAVRFIPMNKLVYSQVVVLSVLTLLAYLMVGKQTGLSVLLGGLSYTLPTAVALWVVKMLKPYPNMAAIAFISSASLKIVLALILMVSTFIFYPELHFLSFFIGLLAVSHFVFLFFLKVYRYGK